MKWYLVEDKRHKFDVKVSYEIENAIDNIIFHNSENDKGLEDWGNYIDGIKCYISNPAIALDYMREFIHTHEDETYINKLGMDVGFTIGVDDITNKTYVYIFYLDLKAEDFGLNESIRKTIIHLTSSDLKRIITESVQRILQEPDSKVDKVLGEYNVLDGMWWDGQPHGLESKGNVQDVRMYDKRTNGDSFETIALFRRCDNLKYFYARIIPINGTKETKWEPIPLNEVPNIIRKDIYTINPQGHEPYLRF